MENIEIDNSENLLCPYCQKLLIDKESDPDYTTCDFSNTSICFKYFCIFAK